MDCSTVRWGPPRTPAPLPHLPTSPHELLTAYLEVVGIHSADCYGVQLTRTSERDVLNPFDPFSTFPQFFNRNQRPSLGPYCGELP